MNTDQIIQKLAQEAGVSEQEARQLFTTMIPVIGAKLKQNASTESEAIEQAIKTHAVSSTSDARELKQDGEKILGHIFKGDAKSVTEVVSKLSSINTDKAQDLVKEFAPLVMGIFGKEGISQEDLEQVLTKTSEKALGEYAGPAQGLLKMLDLDKDGSIGNDIPKILGFLKKMTGFLPKR